MESEVAAQSENSKNIFADFVASLENDLDQPSGGAPLKKQKTEKKRKAPKKRETTSTYKGGNLEINEGDKSEKIVRNLFSQITIQISAFSAKLVPTNFFLTDQNQTPEKYHNRFISD